MAKFSGKDLEKWLKTQITGDSSITFDRVSTDSRRVEAGDLFVALKGEKFDGNDYVAEVYKAGCRGMVVSRTPEGDLPGACIFLVEDTQRALQTIGAKYRSRFTLPVVGITGSVGKTTTKEYVYSVLATHGKTLKTQGNLNNEIGLPMSVLELDQSYWAAVFELGMNHFGEMERLTHIAKPTIRVITNIGVAHIENLGSREGICEAKMELAQEMGEGDMLLLNGDEPLLYEKKDQLTQPVLYFGIKNKSCDFIAQHIVQTPEGQEFTISGKINIACKISQKGEHNIYNALCAVACGCLLNLSPEEITQGLLNFQNAPMRQNIYEKNGMMVIDDCYNANPDSMKAAINVLASMETKGEGRKIAVLGDMLELGDFSQKAHEEIGRYAAENGVSYLFLKGKAMEHAKTGALEANMPPSHIIWKETDVDLAEAAKSILHAGDCALFKGSRGMKIERVLALMLEEKVNV